MIFHKKIFFDEFFMKCLNLKFQSKKLIENETVTGNFTTILIGIQDKEKTVSRIVELEFQDKILIS